MRLDRYLHDLGFGSRKDIDRLLHHRRVTVDGEIVKKGAMHVSLDSAVCVDGECLTYAPEVWMMLNKPEGVVSAVKDAQDETVLDLLPERFSHMRVAPVGRLDKDTTGLLLLTNDGALAHRVMRPKSGIMKTYAVTYEEALVPDAVERCRVGIDLDDFVTAPAELVLEEEGHCTLSISEGKYHQVKRMLHALGGVVVGLKRIAIGRLALDPALAPGEWRLLTADEIEILQQDAKKEDKSHESI